MEEQDINFTNLLMMHSHITRKRTLDSVNLGRHLSSVWTKTEEYNKRIQSPERIQ